MHYRKLQADGIFNGFDWANDRSVLILDETGQVENIVSEENAGDGVERFNGIITPGFVNAHCHLELSHLKNKVPPRIGLVAFLLTVIKSRAATKKEILRHIFLAEEEMFENGIVAAADICNTDHTVPVKKESKLSWYNQVEVINLHDRNWPAQLQKFSDVIKTFNGLKKTLTPHAPYSVSSRAFTTINEQTAQSVISIHNQETAEENYLFMSGEGEFIRFYETLGEEGSPFSISGKSSLQTWLPYFTKGQTIVLVHNTFISEEDLLFAKTHAEKFGLKLVYCLCPNANLYIENRLPPVDLLMKHECKIVIGTDSYSSNWQLNIAAEIKTLQEYFPQLLLKNLLKYATSNGAELLNLSSDFGSFEKGKQPGVVLLEMNENKLTGKSTRIL
jgi:cytosine/adenosine deaminase-related metal-dependent hydrolase